VPSSRPSSTGTPGPATESSSGSSSSSDSCHLSIPSASFTLIGVLFLTALINAL
jgi:hypothetical protein